MKVTYLARGFGKTTRAAKEAKKTGAIFVVINHTMKRMVVEKYGLSEKRVMTHEEFLNEDAFDRLRGVRLSGAMGMPEFIIDDVEYLLSRIPPFGDIRRITLSKPLTKAQCKKRGYPPECAGLA